MKPIPESEVNTPVLEHDDEDEESWLSRLGPGLITGAADDDPSGIATYSQAGAHVGRVTGRGLATNLQRFAPRPLVWAIVGLMLIANVINIAADISAMGESITLVAPGQTHWYAVAFGVLSVLLQVFVPYQRYVNLLKWLTLVLLAYVATVFVVNVPWGEVALRTVLPHMEWNKQYVTTVVAVLGTTISPYLFALGIVGTGLLAIPVLAGSAAYAMAGTFHWQSSLDKKFSAARKFYGIIIVATLAGVAIDFAPIDPIKALYWSAVINGVMAVPVMAVMMLVASSRKIMGDLPISGRLKLLGWVCTAVMAAASLIMFGSFLLP